MGRVEGDLVSSAVGAVNIKRSKSSRNLKPSNASIRTSRTAKTTRTLNSQYTTRSGYSMSTSFADNIKFGRKKNSSSKQKANSANDNTTSRKNSDTASILSSSSTIGSVTSSLLDTNETLQVSDVDNNTGAAHATPNADAGADDHNNNTKPASVVERNQSVKSCSSSSQNNIKLDRTKTASNTNLRPASTNSSANLHPASANSSSVNLNPASINSSEYSSSPSSSSPSTPYYPMARSNTTTGISIAPSEPTTCPSESIGGPGAFTGTSTTTSIAEWKQQQRLLARQKQALAANSGSSNSSNNPRPNKSEDTSSNIQTTITKSASQILSRYKLLSSSSTSTAPSSSSTPIISAPINVSKPPTGSNMSSMHCQSLPNSDVAHAATAAAITPTNSKCDRIFTSSTNSEDQQEQEDSNNNTSITTEQEKLLINTTNSCSLSSLQHHQPPQNHQLPMLESKHRPIIITSPTTTTNPPPDALSIGSKTSYSTINSTKTVKKDGAFGFWRFKKRQPEMVSSSDLDHSQGPTSPLGSNDYDGKSQAESKGIYPVFKLPLEQAIKFNTPFESTDIFARSDSIELQICDLEYQKYVPLIVLKCVKFITKYGLEEEGLYRVSGSTPDVKRLQHRFMMEGPTFDLDPRNDEIHTVASLFKLYLRELPDDVVPVQRHQFLAYSPEQMFTAPSPLQQHSASSQEEFPYESIPLQVLQEELVHLPFCNFALLHVLIRHLSAVVKNEATNRMSLSNLAVVFAPTLRISKLLFMAVVSRGDLLWKDLHPTTPKPTSDPTFNSVEPYTTSNYSSDSTPTATAGATNDGLYTGPPVGIVPLSDGGDEFDFYQPSSASTARAAGVHHYNSGYNHSFSSTSTTATNSTAASTGRAIGLGAFAIPEVAEQKSSDKQSVGLSMSSSISTRSLRSLNSSPDTVMTDPEFDSYELASQHFNSLSKTSSYQIYAQNNSPHLSSNQFQTQPQTHSYSQTSQLLPPTSPKLPYSQQQQQQHQYQPSYRKGNGLCIDVGRTKHYKVSSNMPSTANTRSPRALFLKPGSDGHNSLSAPVTPATPTHLN